MNEVWEWLREPFTFAFMQRALIALLIISVVSAVIGTFVVLKGMAFIGDALAHASFAGVAIAFVMGASIYIGAAVAAVVTAIAIALVSRRSKLSFDTSIGILFVGAFELGIVIISRQSSYTVDLFSYVFGNVLGVGWDDVLLTAVMGVIVVGLIGLFYKELLFTSYDDVMAAASGIPVAAIQYGLLVLLAIATVVALRAVGIVLVVAMLVTPAATASLLVRRVPLMMLVGSLVGAFSSVAGLYVSYYGGVASGATVVLVATALFFIALVVSPRAGLIAELRRRSAQAETQAEPSRLEG